METERGEIDDEYFHLSHAEPPPRRGDGIVYALRNQGETWSARPILGVEKLPRVRLFAG